VRVGLSSLAAPTLDPMPIYGDAYGGPPPRRQWQRVLNTSWPLRDDKSQPHARGIKDAEHPIAVTVRIIWEVDGEEWIDGTATRWHGRSVFVRVDDARPRWAARGLHRAGVGYILCRSATR